MLKRHPSKDQAFMALKNMGFPVEAVVDVGVLTCTTALMGAYPNVPHILVEPIEEFHPDIRRIYQNAGIQYRLVKAAASDSDGMAKLKTTSVRSGKDITHSRLTTEKGEGDDFRIVPTITIETLIKEHTVPKPFLLKIDVDGAELDVMRGALPAVSNCSVLCVEAGLRNFTERCNAALTLGFELFDIVDLCYYGERFVQADFIFINSQMVRNLKLQVYADGFDVEKWSQYSPEAAHQNVSGAQRFFRSINRMFSDS
ncbi:MAG: FkbM family methyltransferase [Litorimonas sp.]